MKIVCCGDVHAHQYREFAEQVPVKWDGEFLSISDTEVFLNSRLFRILCALVSVRIYCQNTKTKVVVIAGDLFHKRSSLSTVTFNWVYRIIESFKEVGIQVVFIPGNHDKVTDDVNSETSIYSFKNISTVLGLEGKPELLEFRDQNTCFIGLPYSRKKPELLSSLSEVLLENRKKLKTYKNRILIAHIGITGGYIGKYNYVHEENFQAEELRYDQFSYVVLGHYHKPQILKGTKNMFYTGSLLQNDFNDEGEGHGFWVIDTVKNSLEFIELSEFPKFVTITEKDTVCKGEHANDYVRIQASEKRALELAKSLEGNKTCRLELTKDYGEVLGSEVDASMSYEEIIQKYTEDEELSGLGLKLYKEVKMGDS